MPVAKDGTGKYPPYIDPRYRATPSKAYRLVYGRSGAAKKSPGSTTLGNLGDGGEANRHNRDAILVEHWALAR